MANAWDYAVTYGFGNVPGYDGFHTGEDRPTPLGTPVPVNGVIIGLTGNTGKSTGPHIHTGRIVGGAPTNPNGGGKTLGSDAKVTQIDTVGNTANGKFVRVHSQGVDWVYLHLSEVKVKVGDVLQGGTAMTEDELNALWQIGTDTDKNDPEGAKFIRDYKGKKPIEAELAVLNSARNKELRRKAGEYDKVKPVLDDAQNWKNYAIKDLIPEIDRLKKEVDGETAKKLEQLQSDIKSALDKSKE